MVWGEIIGAGASLVGGLLSNKGQRDANSATAASADRQMDFQEAMSNSAYQRATADMRKAGINPMLAYKQGGASTPGGAAYTAQNEMASAPEAINSAFTNMRAVQEIKLTKATIEKTKAQARRESAEADKAELTKAPYKYGKSLMEKLEDWWKQPPDQRDQFRQKYGKPDFDSTAKQSFRNELRQIEARKADRSRIRSQLGVKLKGK